MDLFIYVVNLLLSFPDNVNFATFSKELSAIPKL
jgi:hypothetical protein